MRYFCVVHNWDAGLEPCPACRRGGARASAYQRAASAAVAAQDRARAATAMRAIVAVVEGDVSDLEVIFTPDVSGSGPATAARSREELAVELDERREAFLQREVTFGHLAVNGDMARIEWTATGLHTGPFVLERNGVVMEPTGLRLRIHAVTVAKFRDDQICSWRSTWDDMTMMDRVDADAAAAV